MKTPKEKAEEMLELFSDNYTFNGDGNAKNCALIAVDLILKPRGQDDVLNERQVKYWKSVKEEIKKL